MERWRPGMGEGHVVEAFQEGRPHRMQQARSKADEPQHQAKRRKQSSSELQKLKPPLRLDHELSRFRLSWTARARLCMPRRKPVWPVAIQTLTPLGSGSSPPQVLEDPLQRLTVDVAVTAIIWTPSNASATWAGTSCSSRRTISSGR